MSLDKLREIEKRITDGPDTDEAWQERDALSHLLLPAMEALVCDNWRECCQNEPDVLDPPPTPTCLEEVAKDRRRKHLCAACAVVGQLEEAL